MKSHALFVALPLAAVFAMSGASVADAQPGMTPPGSTPPYSAPPPASPGPAGPPPAQPYGPPPAQPYGPPPVQPAYDQAPAPYYGPPMPLQAPPSEERSGYHIGISGGLGLMESDRGEFACAGCESVAASFDVHAGKMLSPRFALQAELWFQTQSLEQGGTASINQSMFLLAAQYWLHPRIWLKGGVGFSTLTLSFADGGGGQNESLGTGLATELAVGFEMMRSARFSFDAQIKTGWGNYEEREENVAATSFNLGVNWY